MKPDLWLLLRQRCRRRRPHRIELFFLPCRWALRIHLASEMIIIGRLLEKAMPFMRTIYYCYRIVFLSC